MTLEHTVKEIGTVTTKNDGYVFESELTVEGTVTKIQPKKKTVFSSAIFTREKRTITGSDIEIENDKGKQTFFYPEDLTNQPIPNHPIKYSKKTWQTRTEGTTTTYKLEILDEPKTYEKRVFV